MSPKLSRATFCQSELLRQIFRKGCWGIKNKYREYFETFRQHFLIMPIQDYRVEKNLNFEKKSHHKRFSGATP